MLLTEQEIEDVAIFVMNADTFDIKRLGHDFARAVEAKVLEKIKAQGLVGYMHPLDVGRFLNLTSERVSDEQVPVVALLPEGD